MTDVSTTFLIQAQTVSGSTGATQTSLNVAAFTLSNTLAFLGGGEVIDGGGITQDQADARYVKKTDVGTAAAAAASDFDAAGAASSALAAAAANTASKVGDLSALKTSTKASAVAAINELKDSIVKGGGAPINDETTSTSSTWSSQKIIDVLGDPDTDFIADLDVGEIPPGEDTDFVEILEEAMT